MNRIKNVAGQRFGRLLVSELTRREDSKPVWICQCDCGNTTKVQTALLTGGNTRSCGCLKREIAKTYWAGSRRKVHCPSCNKEFEICKGSSRKYCSKSCYRQPTVSLCGHLPVAIKGLCKFCYQKNYRKTHPEVRTAKSRRVYYLKAKYGISLKDYKTLEAKNNKGCWICGKIPSKRERSLNVDHDHEVKERSLKAVRGVLCWRCNEGLSFFRDKPELFRRAANYLEGKLFNVKA